MTATVETKQLSHNFGQFNALQNINLTIAAGKFAVLLGPSGCGKTTLLSILGGFLQPTRGKVLLNGSDVTHVPPAHRPTTTMFQDYALFPHMTLLNNVGFGLRMRGQGKKDRDRKATELLALVGLKSSAHKKPHELSGGQRQRVALARALAVDPDVLLLDEPLGALDLKLRRQMQDELKAIQRRVGTTFVHVTHDQEEAMSIADNIIVMNSGKVEDSGTPESIYLSPKTIFSANFMGDTNIVNGNVRSATQTEFVIESQHGTFILPATTDVNSSITAGSQVALCFRPEHVDTDPSTENHITLGQATLADHAFFGSHQRCLLDLNGSRFVAHLPQSSRLENGQSLVLGATKPSIFLLPSE